MPLFRRLPDPVQLDAILAVLRARGVVELTIGELHVKFDDTQPAAFAGRLEEVGRRLQMPDPGEPVADRQPTNDELLYGVDEYGLGTRAG